MRHRVSVLSWLVALVTFASGSASSQTGFAWHLEGGGVLPMSAYVDTAVRFDGVQGDDEATLSSRLVDAYTQPGFSLATTFLLDQFELRYAFHRLPWDREETRCVGAGTGVELPSGELDDTLVAYDCSPDAPVTGDPIERDPVLLHVVSLGYRVYFIDEGDGAAAGRLNVYAVAAPGLGISSYNDNRSDDGVDLGFNLGLGAGLRVALSSLFSIGLEARYNLFLSGPPGSAQAAANRARQLDQSSWAAALNAFHYTSLSLGLQLSFR